MIVGLGLVGTGFGPAGVVPALAGLLLLVYGIHTFGRLGPEDDSLPPETVALDAAERGSSRICALVASSRTSTGGLRRTVRAIAMRCFSPPEKR